MIERTNNLAIDKPKSVVVGQKVVRTKKADGKKRKRLPTDREIVNPDSAKFNTETGKFEVWKDSPNRKFDPTYKFGYDRTHEYSVEYKGEKVVLNRHKNKISYQGETVEGVPSFYPKLREMDNPSLFKSMAQTMSYVEDGKNNAPAPQWKPTLHGKVDKSIMTRADGRVIDYGLMEIHHKHQFSKQSFDVINKKLEAGEITLDDAKNQMRGLLKPDASVSTGYSIDVADKRDRGLVILAAGTHNITSNLYYANHPMGINPTTGNFDKFGIPKQGTDAGSRDGFDKFRSGFWTEYYRRETFVAANEINRRIKNGQLSGVEADRLWKEAYGKMVKQQDDIRAIRRSALEES